MSKLLIFGPLLLILVLACVTDLRQRRLPNWLTLSLILSGLGRTLMTPSPLTLGQSSWGLLAGFGLAFVLFVIGALGGGDVKLMAGVGAWVGASPVVMVFVVAAVVGMVLVLIEAIWRGSARELLSSTLALALRILWRRRLGKGETSEVAREFRSVGRPLPFAIPVMVATGMTLFLMPGLTRVGL